MPDRLVVAVLTYQRLKHIVELAPMLVAQAAEARAAFDLVTEVVVVDNDPEGSARAVLEPIEGVRYVHEPEPGISAGRNRALDEAADADLIVFIDDDERPTPGWLMALVAAKRKTGAAAIVGRVERIFKGELDPWIAAGGFFNNAHQPSGMKVTAAATSNLLLDLNVVRRLRLRFDSRFGILGGSDIMFTKSLIARGETILWCDEAVVDDQVPSARLTRRWVLKRLFRSGNTDGLVALALATSPRQRLIARLHSLGRGGSRVLVGAIRAVAGTIVGKPGLQAGGARVAARGLGMVAAAVGTRYGEYERLSA